jgi:hypothetical protein
VRSAGVITAAAQLVNELAVRRVQEQHWAAAVKSSGVV